MNQQAWTLLGILLGAGAGAVGAYAGWKRSRSPGTESLPLWVATATLGLTVGLVAVIAWLQMDPARRLILLLPVVLLGHWFARQVRAIRAARKRKPDEHRERCQGK